jgi:predicted alpha/beta superfamily hydrolase
MIGLPENYEKSTKKYPVLYLLDAQWAFNNTQQAIDWLSNQQFGFLPQTIVVSIHTGGEHRERDLLPTMDKNRNVGGGADKLYKFMVDELMPFVDKNYRTYNYKVIGGCSFGGVFVMHAFITNSQLFNGYISVSPAMWWDNNVLLDRTKDFLTKNPNIQNRLHISLTNEGVSMGVDSLATILEKYAPKGLSWKYDKYPDEVHETSGYKGYWDGLKFAFADWHYPLVDFGLKDRLASSVDSAIYGNVAHNILKQPNDVLKSRSGLYRDNYGRIIALTNIDNALQFICNQLPGLTLYPETSDRFFISKTQVQNDLYLKGYDIQVEFPNEDSLVFMANGKPDLTAKKLKCPPLVKLAGTILDKYIGTYSPTPGTTKLHIIKDGDLLKVIDDSNSFHLYPIGENKFYAFVSERGYELEFVSEGSIQASKIKISVNGMVVFESKRLN